MALKRPPVLLIGLFYGTGQVILDNNHLDDLLEMYGDEPIPVLFEYMEENVVPISYFGDAPTPQQISAAFQERGIKPADVPVWFAGDRHVAVEPGGLADQLGIPPASDISPSELARLTEDIERNGFNYKPVTLAFLPGDQNILVDEGARLRAAQQMGMPEVPVIFSVYDSATCSHQPKHSC